MPLRALKNCAHPLSRPLCFGPISHVAQRHGQHAQTVSIAWIQNLSPAKRRDSFANLVLLPVNSRSDLPHLRRIRQQFFRLRQFCERAIRLVCAPIIIGQRQRGLTHSRPETRGLLSFSETLCPKERIAIRSRRGGAQLHRMAGASESKGRIKIDGLLIKVRYRDLPLKS